MKEESASPVARHFFLNKNNILPRHPHRFFCAKFHTPRHLLRKSASAPGQETTVGGRSLLRKITGAWTENAACENGCFYFYKEDGACRMPGQREKRGYFDTTRCAFMKKRHKTFLYVRLRESMAHRNPIFRAAFSRNPCFPGARSGLERIAGFFRGWECAGLARLFLTKRVRYAIIE